MKKAATKKTKKKLSEMEYSDGKNHDLTELKALEELLDIPRANPYQTLDLDVFKERVQTMSVNELTNLANRVGVQATTRESVLRDRLIVSCETYLRRHRSVIGGVDITAAKRDDDVYNDIQDLLKFPKRGSR